MLPSVDLPGGRAARFDYPRLAHERLIGINQWGFWEKSHWFPKAALWRADWTIKPIWQAYLDPIHKTWHTDQTVPTDASGSAKVRRFTGDYEIAVTHNGKTHKATATLTRDGTAATVKME